MKVTSRTSRRGLVSLVVATGLIFGSSGVAHAAKGPGNAKVPPDVVARVAVLQQIFGGFAITPESGPIGTVITFTGHCGFPATTVALSLEHETEPGFNNIVALRMFVPIPFSPFGTFSETLVVPAERLDGAPVGPGTYQARAACNLAQPTMRDLGSRVFTVIGS